MAAMASVRRPLPLVLVPGLLCTAELFGPQIQALGDVSAVSVADHTGHDSMAV